MSLLKSITDYFSKLGSGAAELPSDSAAEEEKRVHFTSADQRGTSVERINGTKVIRAQNEEGRSTLIICTDNGQSINMDEQGNIFIGSGKIGDTGDGGKLTIRPWGDMMVKAADCFDMEVENLCKSEKPMSIKVYGNINVESVGGDAFISGSNVAVRAKKDLVLAGSNVKIQAGEGSGLCTIDAGSFDTNVGFINHKVTGGFVSTVTGEYTIRQILDPRASFNITSAGHASLKFGGDLNTIVTGKADISILGTPPKPIPTAKDPVNTLSLKVAAGNALMSLPAGNLTQTVVGALTQSITGNITSTAEGNMTYTHTGNITKTVTGTTQTTTTGNATETYQAKRTLNVTGNNSETFQGTHTENTTGVATYTAQGAMVIAGATIKLN